MYKQCTILTRILLIVPLKLVFCALILLIDLPPSARYRWVQLSSMSNDFIVTFINGICIHCFLPFLESGSKERSAGLGQLQQSTCKIMGLRKILADAQVFQVRVY